MLIPFLANFWMWYEEPMAFSEIPSAIQKKRKDQLLKPSGGRGSSSMQTGAEGNENRGRKEDRDYDDHNGI